LLCFLVPATPVKVLLAWADWSIGNLRGQIGQ
jgi:hypothetical protein